MTIQSNLVVRSQNLLGEGPLWHTLHQKLYWVDIESKIVHSFDPRTKERQEWAVPGRVGTVAAAANGKMIVGLQGWIAELDTATGSVTKLVDLEADRPELRCNDGKIDPAGRFWVGTMHLQTQPGTGSLYCLDGEVGIHKVLTGLTIANGLGWSPDGHFMYYIDSADRYVRRYRFRGDTPSLEGEEIVLRFTHQDELPDGMCVDAEGMLWIGFWGGYRVGRYDPTTGRHLLDVNVAAPHVTSCCFGGRDLATLYITTARVDLTPEQLQQYPLSGSVFACNPGTVGMDTHSFSTRTNG